MSSAFFEAVKNLPKQKPVKLEYRLYYDPESGKPLFYTSLDEPGTYIVVDKSTYNTGNYHCIVTDGVIINLNVSGTYRKLVPSNTGVTTHPENAMIVTETGKQWAIKTYED